MKGLAAVVLVVASAGAGCAGLPGDDSAEAGFARDMATHHAQAAEMAFIVRDATRDEHLRSLTYDIIVTQSAQRGMFMAWLQSWGLPQASTGARMAWMPQQAASTHDTSGTHAMADMPLMMGMASDAELAALRLATGRDAEVLFLQLMIRHHEGGVLMARALLEQSSREEVVTMAQSIDSGQGAEIAAMTTMLADRGAKPFASLLR